MFITARPAAVRSLLIAFAALALGAADSARSPQPAGAVGVQDSAAPYAHRLVGRRCVWEPPGGYPRVGPGGGGFVHIPWRRPDAKPEDRHLVVVDGHSGGRILNVERMGSPASTATSCSRPRRRATTSPTTCRATGTGRANYPTVTTRPRNRRPIPAWLKKHGLDGRNAGTWTPGSMPAASVVEFQAIEPLHSFFPMQVVATQDEVAGLLARQPAAPFFVFAEDRTRPIKMASDLPLRWVRRGAGARSRARRCAASSRSSSNSGCRRPGRTRPASRSPSAGLTRQGGGA